MSSDVGWHLGQAETSAKAWFNIALRPRKPEGSLGRTAQDGHLDTHTAPELWPTRVGVGWLFTPADFPARDATDSCVAIASTVPHSSVCRRWSTMSGPDWGLT